MKLVLISFRIVKYEMIGKKRSYSSSIWMKEHFRDKYIKKSKKKKIRSRSWFKLDEIQKNKKIFKKGMKVVDLGSSPGSWSQYVMNHIGVSGDIISCDIFPMDPIVGVNFLHGDFSEKKVIKILINRIGKNPVQVVMSDLSPNISGNPTIDIQQSIYLIELVLSICRRILILGGILLVKVFHGYGLEKYLREIQFLFTNMKIHKPDASRARSREVYIVATGRKL